MVARSFLAFDNSVFVDQTTGVGIINNSDTPVGREFVYTGIAPVQIITLDDGNNGANADIFNDDDTSNHVITDGGTLVADGTVVESESFHFVRQLDSNGNAFGPVITINVFSQGGTTQDIWGMTTSLPLIVGARYEKVDGSNAGSSPYVDFVSLVAEDDAPETDEDTAVIVDVLANDVDVDGDPITVTSATNGANGTTVVNSDGTITYTPDPNFFGSDTFSYQITDGTGETETAFVNVTVNPVNDDPVAADDAADADDDGLATINVLSNDSDIEGDTLSVSSAGNGATGLVTINGDGTLSYDANGQFAGLGAGETAIDTFTYTVTDGNGGSDTATVSVTVTGTNVPPVAADDTAFMFRGGTTDVDVLANDTDADGDPLQVTDVSLVDPAIGSVSVNQDGTVNFTPDADFVGQAVIDYVVSDGAGGSDTASLTVTVAANFAPFISEPVSFEIDENQALAADLLAFDLEGDPITWSIVGGPDAALFDIDAQTGQLTFLEAPDFENPLDVGADNDYNVTVRASDPFGSSDQPILVTVLDVECPNDLNCENPPPMFTNPTAPPSGGPATLFISSFSQGQIAVFEAVDTPDDTFSFRLFGEDADLFDINPITGVLSLDAPVPGIAGSFDTDSIYELTVLVEDSAGGTDLLDVLLPLITAA
ncbi:MAG: Ig-like domain-containing protein [Pseudomonadota bacterium]